MEILEFLPSGIVHSSVVSRSVAFRFIVSCRSKGTYLVNKILVNRILVNCVKVSFV